MQQTGIGTAALDCHVEGSQRQVTIVYRAQCPADDEARVEIEDRREIQLGVAADNELRGIANPALIRPLGGELSIKHIGRHGLVVLAHRGRSEALASPCAQPLLPHQPADALLTDALTRLVQVLPDARPAVAPAAGVMRGPDLDAQLAVSHRARRRRPLLPRVEATRRDRQGPTTLRHRELGPLRGDPGELHAWCLAKKAVAFLRNSCHYPALATSVKPRLFARQSRCWTRRCR